MRKSVNAFRTPGMDPENILHWDEQLVLDLKTQLALIWGQIENARARLERKAKKFDELVSKKKTEIEEVAMLVDEEQMHLDELRDLTCTAEHDTAKMLELNVTWAETVYAASKLQREVNERLQDVEGAEDRMKAALSSD